MTVVPRNAEVFEYAKCSSRVESVPHARRQLKPQTDLRPLHSSKDKLFRPSKSDPNGEAVYNQGKSVKDIRYEDGSVIIDFEDPVDKVLGGRGSIRADLVIAADGSASYGRQPLQPHLKHTYAGYVAWRGTVLESDVSEEARNTFKLKITLFATTHGYIALYSIPGGNGTLGPGKLVSVDISMVRNAPIGDGICARRLIRPIRRIPISVYVPSTVQGWG